MPKSKLNTIGIWENKEYIGTIIFGVSVTSDLVKQYGLDKFDGCELVRIALKEHDVFVTKLIRMSIVLLRKRNPDLRLLVSYADPEHSHIGRIYQASNWIYTGCSISADEYIINGKRWHGRSLRHSKPNNITTWEHARKLDKNAKRVKGSSKHRYLYPLDKGMRRQIEKLAQPYPQAEEVSKVIHSTSSWEGLVQSQGSAPKLLLERKDTP